MINFRFHIISIVAIFLALGIGIIMGSTVIDRAIVDGLRTRIDIAESNSINRKEQNDQLQDDIKKINEQDTILAAHSVREYLNNQSVYVIVVGDVSDSDTTEVVELSALAGAQVSSVIKFSDDFILADKKKLLESYITSSSNPAQKPTVDDSQKVMLSYFENALNVLRDKNTDESNNEIDYDSYLSFLVNKSAYSENNVFQNPMANQNVSFMVLVDQQKLSDTKYANFVTDLQNNFPLTIGIVGSENLKLKPTRVDAAKKLISSLSDINLVDTADSPSGRISLIIAHKDNIAGKKGLYGVTSVVNERAPAL
ncbi:MAG: copper transporter [Acidimicrobiia bacterium]|nr:copper transporter [Acidimicrobiia bacterium]